MDLRGHPMDRSMKTWLPFSICGFAAAVCTAFVMLFAGCGEDKPNESRRTAVPDEDTPVAQLAVTPESGISPLEVVLDASQSSTDSAMIVIYSFDFGDGSSSYEETSDSNDGEFDGRATHTYGVEGDYIARVTVTADNGLSGSDSATVSTQSPALPTASLEITPDTCAVGQELLIDASSSTSGRPIVAYHFRFTSHESYSETPDSNDGAFDGKTTYDYDFLGAAWPRVVVVDDLGRGETVSDTVIVNVNGPVTQLTFDRGCEPVWSPDGTQIAFYGQSNGDWYLCTMDANGRNKTALCHTTWTISPPMWSPSGERILIGDWPAGNRDILSVEADGSGVHRIADGPSDETFYHWSPDGEKVTYTAVIDGQRDIFVMDYDGGNKTNLTNSLTDEWSSRWSPDGTRLVFRSDSDGDTEVFVMDADGTDIHQLTQNSMDESYLRWSPDGIRIAFGAVFSLWVIDASGDNLTELTDLQTPRIQSPCGAWSADGSRLAMCDNSRMNLVDADGGNFIHLDDALGIGSVYVDWSPDGTLLAYTGGGNVRIIQVP